MTHLQKSEPRETWLNQSWHVVRHDSLSDMSRDMTPSVIWHFMNHSYVWHESWIHETRLLQWDMTPWVTCHATWLLEWHVTRHDSLSDMSRDTTPSVIWHFTRDKTASVRHDSFSHETWLVYSCEMSQHTATRCSTLQHTATWIYSHMTRVFVWNGTRLDSFSHVTRLDIWLSQSWSGVTWLVDVWDALTKNVDAWDMTHQRKNSSLRKEAYPNSQKKLDSIQKRSMSQSQKRMAHLQRRHMSHVPRMNESCHTNE